MKTSRLLAHTALAWALSAGLLRAEEGMWTFDAFPVLGAEQAVGVRLDQDWLDHVRKASVRLTSGCSGALVSRSGLMVTNQHCVLPCEQAVSSAGADYIRDGFAANGAAEERACPGLQAEILLGIVDITDAVFRASARKSGDDFVGARESVMSRAEAAACRGDPALRCQVISFYGGGQFKVYKYRVYDDVRLVFAPELAIAFHGGDHDNFSFPRHALDVAFLRLWEKGRPAPVRDWLAWDDATPRAGQAVFVSGNPGMTERALTSDQLVTQRDLVLPSAIAARADLRARLLAFASAGPAQGRAAAAALFTQENALKLLRGREAALRDPAFMAARREADQRARRALAAQPRLARALGDPWGELAALQKPFDDNYLVWRDLEADGGGGSRLFAWARALVRGTAERARPTAGRLPDFTDARLALTRKVLLDDDPVEPDLERLYLEAWLSTLASDLKDRPAATAMLGHRSPAELARALAASGLADPARRLALWNGGMAALTASDDPMIAYVLATDPVCRAARDVWENDVLGPAERAAERIAQARFLLGEGIYPDATFSPRLSYGRVAGWDQGGATVGPFTRLGGLFAAAPDGGDAPDRWLRARGALDETRVLDFVTTNDITGGNSGSPILDSRARVLGVAFDGNQGSIAGDFAYDQASNRTVAVAAGAVTEALVHVYGQGALAAELSGR